MSVILLDLKKAGPLSDFDVERFSRPESVKAFAQGVAQAQAFNQAFQREPSNWMPPPVADAILHIPEEYTVGRCGLHAVTSTWTKENYPGAKYELVFTLVANDGKEVHTLLMYFL